MTKQMRVITTSIARQHLGIETLETYGRDNKDFHDLAVWNIKAALEAAYEAGAKSENAKKADKTCFNCTNIDICKIYSGIMEMAPALNATQKSSPVSDIIFFVAGRCDKFTAFDGQDTPVPE